MEIDRENPSPLTRLPGAAEAAWQAWGQELDTDSETAYLQQLAGVDRLEDATTLQLVVNTAAGGSIAHLGSTLPNLLELNLNGSALDSLRDLGTGFRLLQVLWVSRCGLTALDGLNGLPALRELYAAYNDISDLQPVDACQHLEVLDLECNCIPDTDAVLYLAACSSLQTLTLTGNPAADQPQYRAQVIAALPSLTSLDDEPVPPQGEGKQLSTSGAAAPSTTSPASSPPHDSGSGRHSNSVLTAGHTPDGASPLRSSQHSPLAPPAFKAAAAAVETSYTTALLSPRQEPAASASSSGATHHNRPSDTASPPAAHAPSTQRPPAAPPGPQDAEEVALVVAGIKHARVGVDSQEFREIEMNMLVATADGAEVALDARPGTGGLMPSSATTWMRTLRSSREGSLAALRASQQAAACSGTHSPSSACSASPSSSRPPSSQQQQQQHQPADRWALPVGHSFGHNGGPPGPPPGGRRPSSGTGAPPDGVGRPASGGYRPASASRPFSARPGTATSMGGRMGTASSVGAAPSASLGLYWAKNRLGSGGAGGEGQGTGSGGGAGALLEVDLVDGSSRLTQGTGTSFGGSLAKDLRKWKGAAVVRAGSAGVASAAASGALTGGSVSGSGVAPGGGDTSGTSGGAGANGNTVATGGTSLSLSLLRGGQLDPHALLEELKRWKVETADKVLLADPDGEHSGGLGGGPGWGADTLEPGGLGDGRKADILQLSSSHDGAPMEAVEGGSGGGAGGGVGGAGLGALLLVEHGPEPASSPALPCSPQVPLGAPQGGRARKMVLSKVVRDMYTDSVGSSGASIGEVLSKRPVHPPRGQLLHSEAAQGQQQQQQQGQGMQQQAVQRVGSGRSGCSSSGQSDHGLAASYGGHSYASRPGSREEGAGGHLQYQRLGSAKGTPGSPGPGQYRVSSVAGELDVRSANPQPRVRRDDSDED